MTVSVKSLPDGRVVFAYLGWPKNRQKFYLDILYPGTTRINDEYDYSPLYGPAPEPATEHASWLQRIKRMWRGWL
jgi:hypothetical protein